jgi:ketosteroid isomerase-like protein
VDARRREADPRESRHLQLCEGSASDLRDVKTTFSKFKVITTGDCVVIDSRAEYLDADGESSHVASCDIYEFIDGNIVAITSYTIEVPPGR